MNSPIPTDFWNAAWQQRIGLPGGRGLNIAQEAVGARSDQGALRWLRRCPHNEYSHGELVSLSSRFAAGATVLVTTRRHYRRTIAACHGRLPQLRHTLLINGDEGGVTLDFQGRLASGACCRDPGDRQGLRRPRTGMSGRRYVTARAARALPAATGPGAGAANAGVPRQPAEDAPGKGAVSAVEGPRSGIAGWRSLHPAHPGVTR